MNNQVPWQVPWQDRNLTIFIGKCLTSGIEGICGDAVDYANSKWCTCPPPEIQGKLFEKAVKGGTDDINHFIVCNTRLITEVITRLIRSRRCAIYLSDDLFSAGLLSLTSAVHTLVHKFRQSSDEKLQATLDQWGNDGPELKVPPYLYVAIYRVVRELYECDSSEPLTLRRRRSVTNSDGDITRKIPISTFMLDMAKDVSLEFAESFQGILSTARTPVERKIITMRMEAYTDSQIGEAMGLSTSTVQRTRIKLHERFCREQDYDFKS